MKKYLKSIDIAALISALYFSAVWMAYIYLNLTSSVILTLVLTLFVAIGSYIALKFVIKKLRALDDLSGNELARKKKLIIFTAIAVVTFLLRLVWILAYYPGSFSPDSINQYGQALSGSYNDWHPVWHTIIFFTIPLKIFGKPAAIVIMQNIYLALILGYMTVTITEIWNIKAAIISIAYIILNPYTGYIMLYPWKDVGFALGGLLCSIIAVKLVLKNKDTNKLWKLIVLGILLSWTTVFRHNAILFTAPLIVVLAFHVDKKTWIKIFVSFVVSLFVIKVPLYSVLGVEKPGSRVLESTGLPLTVIGNVVKETPDRLDDELADFAYSIAPQEKWAESYYCGTFNSIKWSDGIDTSVVEEQGYLGMLNLMFKCFKISPHASFSAAFALTDMVYGFEAGLEGENGAGITDNDYGIAYTDARNSACEELVTTYSSFINGTIFKYIRTYGVALFAMLVVVLSRLKFNSWKSWKKAFMLVPIFCYDFGTMLLLTGADSRFFFITFLVAPLIIVFALSKGGNEK